jgi:hypothetical protein
LRRNKDNHVANPSTKLLKHFSKHGYERDWDPSQHIHNPCFGRSATSRNTRLSLQLPFLATTAGRDVALYQALGIVMRIYWIRMSLREASGVSVRKSLYVRLISQISHDILLALSFECAESWEVAH